MKMDITVFLTMSAAAILSSVAALTSLKQLVEKLEAERKFRQQIRTKLSMREELLKTLDESVSADPPNTLVILEAQRQIERLLVSLQDSEKRQVLAGLRQPSERGRANYMRKLLSSP